MSRDILAGLDKVEGFDWNKGNVDKNWLKHRVRIKECEEPFFNQPLLLNLDQRHSTKTEKRFQALGRTKEGRKLFVIFTIRNKKIRVISARDQNQKERKQYEQEKI